VRAASNVRIEELLQERRMGEIADPNKPDSYVHGLYELIKDYVTKDSVMVEIGCYRGVSTELFALHCGKIFAIDPWSKVCEGKYVNVERATRKMPEQLEAERVFEERMGGYKNIEIIKDFSYNVYDKFPDSSLDVVYVDGHHSEKACLEDIKNWFPKLKVGGVMSGHDYQIGQIAMVVNQVTKVIPERKRYKDGSWAFIKPREGIEKEI